MKRRVVIYTPVFSPCRVVDAIPQSEACQGINESMQLWGLPQRIKIDNGIPLANAEHREIPTLTQLWWIGLGIEVQLNEFRVPQQNGTVEGLQGICHRWSAPSAYCKLNEYQKRVNETNRVQREVYRIRKKGDKTRKELYPELWQNPRRYDPTTFCMQKIFDDLATRVWCRLVTRAGAISFWKKNIFVGRKFIGQKVTITFDPIERLMLVRATDGRLLKTSNKEFFTQEQILFNAGISKNKCEK